jgi:EpsI family protein
LTFDGWRGTPDRLDREYLQLLQLDDYMLADYSQGTRPPVNLYIAYYNAQTNGNSAHSPRACIPGDGWEIADFSQRELPLVRFKGLALRVNRAVITKGENRQLVYYWFQQRGRVATDEYVVKLQIFLDAVMRHRSDGAMVRLVARLRPGELESAGDAQLESFAATLAPRLDAYIPD